MLIYLTSQASKTLGKLIPFLQKSPKEMKVAFIPTAADLYLEKPWLETDRQKFVDLGFQVEDVDLKQFSINGLKQKLTSKDVIFVAGGTTTYLLEKVRQSGFNELIKELVKNGVVYIGSSAGSLLAGPNVETDRIYDHRGLGKELDSYEGIGLVDFVILPHVNNQKYELVIQEIDQKFGEKFELRKLKDNQAILIKDGVEQLIES